MNALERARRIEFEAYCHMKDHPESESAYAAWRCAADELHRVRRAAPAAAAEEATGWEAAVAAGVVVLIALIVLKASAS